MITPLGYSREQIEGIVKSARDFKLFHCTDVSNFKSIVQLKNIYSLGTLWGIRPATRTQIRTGCPHPSASLGFVDYVFLSKINRLIEGMAPIFGKVCFQITPEVLVYRDSFAYPFNTGYDWSKPWNQTRKRSDATTFERCIQSSFTTDEFLVRRKVNIEEYVEKIYCTHSVHQEVKQMMSDYNWNIDLESVPDTDNASLSTGVTPIKTVKRPNFDIDLIGSGPVSSAHLYYNSSNGNLVMHDPSTNCLTEFKIDGNKLFDPFEGKFEVGSVRELMANSAS